MNAADKRFSIFAVCVIGGLLIIAFVNLFQAHTAVAPVRELTYSQFLSEVEDGHVQTVTLAGHEIAGALADHSVFRTYAPDDPDLVRTLRARAVAITAVAAPAPSPWSSTVESLIPAILMVVVATYVMGRVFGETGRLTGLGKSRARRLAPVHDRVTFADVAGVDEARDALRELVDFLCDPCSFERLGGRIPRGVLLVGPPGTGKTLLARAVAGEADVPFFAISGSDFVEMFVGIGASRVRDMFAQAKKSAPCIIFMDEIDAVGRRRGAGLGGGNDEREQTLNQLLVEMDGFQANTGVILIAATNRSDVLDPALLRPGRFDRQVVVSNPDLLGREQILAVHVRRVPLAPEVDLKSLARGTPGFSGADLMNLVNEAALLAVRRKLDAVGIRELEDAKDTMTMGAERRTHIMSDAERRLVAYREGGRAIVAVYAPAADQVHKVTIVPRGRTVGMIMQLPERDQMAMTVEQMTSRLAVMMAGRAAEELVFGRGKITSGTAADIEEATTLARAMVTRWGLSEQLGAVAYGENQEEVFLGGDSVTRQQKVSEQTAQLIAAEVRKLIDAALAQARRILAAHRCGLDTVAQGLLRSETLSGEQIRNLLVGDTQALEERTETATAAAILPTALCNPNPR